MSERRKPEREVEKEHRKLTRHQEMDTQALVLFWIVSAAMVLSLTTVIGSRC